MNPSPQIIDFASASRNCAMQLMENAAYIQKELPQIFVPEMILDGVKSMCEDWIGTKHDVISELFELSDLFNSSDPGAEVVEARCRMIREMFAELVAPIFQVVEALQEAYREDPACGSALMLIMESATNVLKAIPSA